MTKEEMKQNAVNVMMAYKQNPTIMKFVTNEALEKTAEDIRKKNKGGTTAKAVKLMMIRNSEIAERVQQYIDLGIVACYIAGAEMHLEQHAA